MLKLDFTQPLSTRRDPYTQIKGPFIGPDSAGIMRAIIQESCYAWYCDGKCLGPDPSRDLISLQIKSTTSKCTYSDDSHNYESALRESTDKLVDALNRFVGAVTSTSRTND